MPSESQEIERKLNQLGEKLRDNAEQRHSLTQEERDLTRKAVRESWREQQKEIEKRREQEREKGRER